MEHNCQQLIPFIWGPVQAPEISIDFLFQTVVCSVVPHLEGKKVFHGADAHRNSLSLPSSPKSVRKY